MPDLFGLDIAGIIADSIESAGGVLNATLIKVSNTTRTAADLGGGRNPSDRPIPCKGFYDDKQAKRFPDTIVKTGDRIVLLLGATISGGTVEPAPTDKVTMEGETTRIVEILERDPAAATFICHTRKT